MAIHKVDGVDGVNNFPKKFVTLHTTESSGVTKGDILMIETDATVTDYNKNGVGATVVKATCTATTGDEGLAIIGCAAETTTAAGLVKVQVAGKFENANVTTGITRAKGICVLDGTAGRGVAWTAATNLTLPFAICLETAASNLCDIMITDKGYF